MTLDQYQSKIDAIASDRFMDDQTRVESLVRLINELEKLITNERAKKLAIRARQLLPQSRPASDPILPGMESDSGGSHNNIANDPALIWALERYEKQIDMLTHETTMSEVSRVETIQRIITELMDLDNQQADELAIRARLLLPVNGTVS
jgi:hypothetical protein